MPLSLLIILNVISTTTAMLRFPRRHATVARGITSTSTIRIRVVFGESVTIFSHWESGKTSTAVVRRLSKASSVLLFGRCQVVLHSLASSELRSMREGLLMRGDIAGFSAERTCILSSSMTGVHALVAAVCQQISAGRRRREGVCPEAHPDPCDEAGSCAASTVVTLC